MPGELTLELHLFLQEPKGKKQGLNTFRNMSLAIVTPVQESLPNSWFKDTGLEARRVILFFWLFMGNVLAMAYRLIFTVPCMC